MDKLKPKINAEFEDIKIRLLQDKPKLVKWLDSVIPDIQMNVDLTDYEMLKIYGVGTKTLMKSQQKTKFDDILIREAQEGTMREWLDVIRTKDVTKSGDVFKRFSIQWLVQSIINAQEKLDKLKTEQTYQFLVRKKEKERRQKAESQKVQEDGDTIMQWSNPRRCCPGIVKGLIKGELPAVDYMPVVFRRKEALWDEEEMDDTQESEEDLKVDQKPVLGSLRGRNRANLAYKDMKKNKNACDNKVRGAVDISFKTQFSRKKTMGNYYDPLNDDTNIYSTGQYRMLIHDELSKGKDNSTWLANRPPPLIQRLQDIWEDELSDTSVFSVRTDKSTVSTNKRFDLSQFAKAYQDITDQPPNTQR